MLEQHELKMTIFLELHELNIDRIAHYQYLIIYRINDKEMQYWIYNYAEHEKELVSMKDNVKVRIMLWCL